MPFPDNARAVGDQRGREAALAQSKRDGAFVVGISVRRVVSKNDERPRGLELMGAACPDREGRPWLSSDLAHQREPRPPGRARRDLEYLREKIAVALGPAADEAVPPLARRREGPCFTGCNRHGLDLGPLGSDLNFALRVCRFDPGHVALPVLQSTAFEGLRRRSKKRLDHIALGASSDGYFNRRLAQDRVGSSAFVRPLGGWGRRPISPPRSTRSRRPAKHIRRPQPSRRAYRALRRHQSRRRLLFDKT